MSVNSVKSEALEPTRAELAGLSGGARIARLLPVYGLVILTVLLAVFFWGLLWGIPGAFLGVPIVIALITVCDQIPGSRWVATLLAGDAEERTTLH